MTEGTKGVSAELRKQKVALTEDQIAALEYIVAEFAEDFEDWTRPSPHYIGENDLIKSNEQMIKDARAGLEVIRKAHT